jgi:hypothetical protein
LAKRKILIIWNILGEKDLRLLKINSLLLNLTKFLENICNTIDLRGKLQLQGSNHQQSTYILGLSHAKTIGNPIAKRYNILNPMTKSLQTKHKKVRRYWITALNT